MSDSTLTAISPIDGRYRGKVKELFPYFSEFALIKYRVYVEIEYFISLTEIPLPRLEDFPSDKAIKLRELYIDFNTHEAERIKEIESTINHDVKAVEYFLREKFEEMGLEQYREFIHLGLTSQDINNTALPLAMKDSLHHVLLPWLKNELCGELEKLSKKWEKVPMLARTHGQPASPTRMGKEIRVFLERVNKQLSQLEKIKFYAKFGGATGNLNAHKVAYPDINWKEFSDNFVKQKLQLVRLQTTTQIDHYDHYSRIFDNWKRINSILIDLCQDMWLYISYDYFKQKVDKNEVGSSTMPHKVNPIDFENAEGNLGIANSLFEHLSRKLPVSRLQRDLTDSTVTRNIGVPISHSLLAFKSIIKGLQKLELQNETLERELNNNWAVVGEAIQTILRREGFSDPYETLKQLTRTGEKVTEEKISEFVDQLEIDDEVKKRSNRSRHLTTPEYRRL